MYDKKVLRKNPDMVTRLIGDETILVPVYRTSKEINAIYTLNKAASIVWRMIDNKKTLGKIKNELLKIFDATAEEVNEQMSLLLKDLMDIKALI